MAPRRADGGKEIRRTRRSLALTCCAAVAAFYCGREVLSRTFVGSQLRGSAYGAGEHAGASKGRAVARHAGYEWAIKENPDHDHLVVEQTPKEGSVLVSTRVPTIKGRYNTIIGDKELPKSGRSYWEVKFLSRPNLVWEYIGIAEEKTDPTLPLSQNKKGEGVFYGATWSDHMAYSMAELTKADIEWSKQTVKDSWESTYAKTKKYEEKDFMEMVERGPALTSPGKSIMGVQQWNYKGWRKGTTVGVDVDMDKGSLAFWLDGEYLGPVKDAGGRVIDIKGKKYFPAMSLYGRNSGMNQYFSKVEVRTGLEPPPLP